MWRRRALATTAVAALLFAGCGGEEEEVTVVGPDGKSISVEQLYTEILSGGGLTDDQVSCSYDVLSKANSQQELLDLFGTGPEQFGPELTEAAESCGAGPGDAKR